MKLRIDGEEITVAAFYDTSDNTAIHLDNLESMLEDLGARNEVIMVGDFNTISTKNVQQN